MQGLRFINDKYAWHPMASHRKEEKQSFFVAWKFHIDPLCLCTNKDSVNSVVKIFVDKWAGELQNCNIKCHREYYNVQQRKVFCYKYVTRGKIFWIWINHIVYHLCVIHNGQILSIAMLLFSFYSIPRNV